MNAKGFRAKSKDWLPYLVYALLSLGILGELLWPGYILTLDIVFTPKLNVSPQLYGLSQSLSSTVPFWLFFNTASEVIVSPKSVSRKPRESRAATGEKISRPWKVGLTGDSQNLGSVIATASNPAPSFPCWLTLSSVELAEKWLIT